MISNWLRYNEEYPSPYEFRFVRVTEQSEMEDTLIRFLGKEILQSYRSLDFLKDQYGQEEEEALRKYIESYVFPTNSNPLSKNVSQGDFGEILTKLIVTEFSDFVVPIQKLRWKLNREKALFCTDMIAHNAGDQIEDIRYFEVKTRLHIRKETVRKAYEFISVHAHNSLLRDENSPSAGIADFLSRYFYEKEDYESAARYHALVKNPGDYSRAFELFLIIEESKYRDEIMIALNDLPPTLEPLKVTIVLVEQLGRLILAARRNAIEDAVVHVHGERYE